MGAGPGDILDLGALSIHTFRQRSHHADLVFGGSNVPDTAT